MVNAIKDKLNIKYLVAITLALTFVLFSGVCVAQDYKIKTVVIDPGHGGKDPGARGAAGSYEKYIALKVGLMLGQKIQAAYPDVKIIYTRRTDVFVPLHERASIANRNNADLFISIHCNATKNRAAYGTETFVLGLHKTDENLEVAKRENAVITLEQDYQQMYDGFDPNAPETHILLALNQNAFLEQSTLFASKVQHNFTKDLKRHNRGVKQAGFAVLARATMPSVLTELGFISNPSEEKYMTSQKGQEELATALFKAFSDYKSAMEGSPRYVVSQSVVQGDQSASSISAAPAETAVPQRPAATAPQKKDKPLQQTTAPAPQATAQITTESSVVFKVQFAARSTVLDTQAAPFNSFSNISYDYQNGIYKYMVGSHPTYHAAKNELASVKNKGFSDAFIVVYKNGQRLSPSEAKKYFQ